jgi:hypothetical protein
MAPAAPATLATPDAPAAPIAVGVLHTPCGTFLPLRGDDNGLAHSVTTMTDVLLRGCDADV